MDIGTLMNAGNGGPNREIFRIAQIQRMRIFVNVPQTYAALIRTGQQAELRVQELPGQMFAAIVARTTGSVDANSRTMLAILETPNPRGILLPGMYAQVKFSFPGSKTALLVPGDALLLGREGPARRRGRTGSRRAHAAAFTSCTITAPIWRSIPASPMAIWS